MMSTGPSAANFRDVFEQCYEETRSNQSDHWKGIWNDTFAWSRLMIYYSDAVVRKVAPRLNLECAKGEPFRLDAVFHADGAHHWFPMCVAIEHENSPFTFYKEIRALLSVRCPLKVGVTYTLRSDIRGRDSSSELADLRNKISNRIYTDIAGFIKEDPDTEYLFLIGSEDEPYEIRGYSVDFRAGNPPDDLPIFRIT
jgi:hypothetical protein